MFRAKFKGADNSMGFKTGKIYNLKSRLSDDLIIVETKDNKLRCLYSSIETFLQNWKLL